MAESDGDSDAPEEITAEQGIKQDEEIRRIQRENIIRVAQEGKELRRQWAQRNHQVKLVKENVQQAAEAEDQQEEHIIPGMLPSNVVDLLAAREKKTFSSDSEEEIVNHKPTSKKKKRQKTSGPETVLLKETPPPQCLENSLEFLKRRKMQVARSTSVLKNANQALRLLSSGGSSLSRG